MRALQFMPWCRIDKTYTVGGISIIPFRRGEEIPGADEATGPQVETIVSSYKNLEGSPVAEAALVQYGDRPLLADLSDDEREITLEWVDIASFCGLAKREFFNNLGPYCNADCFTAYSQQFDSSGFAGIRTRRREGRTASGRSLAGTAFSVPVHVSPIECVSLDEKLVAALVSLHNDASDEEWARWQNAISCFNQANTDSDTIRYQVEWVLLCCAFEHILGAESRADDVATRFTQALVPSTQLSGRDAKRRPVGWTSGDKPLRYEWMREFYRIRGDFAHGRLRTRQPSVWNPLEHLVLATIGFTLLARCLLYSRGKDALTDNDRAQIDAFEGLADEQFLDPPGDQRSPIDSVWSRLVDKAKWEVQKRKILEDPEIKGLWNGMCDR